MNISEYLKTSNCKPLSMRVTEYPSYINIQNALIIICTEDIFIDKPIDALAMSIVQNNTTINSTINIKTFYRGDYYKLIPGSFVGTSVRDKSNIHIHNITVNGYLMNNGVLS